jgi:hypothetical protein
MTRTFLKAALACSAATCAVAASASDVIGVRLKLGYHFTQSFELKNGSTGNLQGPEVAADFPLTKYPGLQLYVTPSIMFGGKLTHGSDVDGTIYRFMVTARQTLNKDGLFGALGIGAAHSESRGTNEFRDANSFVTSACLGTPLKFKLGGIGLNLEGTYYFSTKDQFRGFTIGVSGSF